MDFYDLSVLRRKFNIEISSSREAIIALAGNPNTGKSTIFNNLTGMRQHTGNWPGKTVLQAQGEYVFAQRTYKLVDLPGTYSLFANSTDEKVARDFICFARPDATVVVADATCLERNLNLVLQVLEITSKVIVCVNLIDEAEKKAITVDVDMLSQELGVPVIGAAARSGRGIKDLKNIIKDMVEGKIKTSPRIVKYDAEIEESVEKIQKSLKNTLISEFINPRWLALRLIDGDNSMFTGLRTYLGWDSEALV